MTLCKPSTEKRYPIVECGNQTQDFRFAWPVPWALSYWSFSIFWNIHKSVIKELCTGSFHFVTQLCKPEVDCQAYLILKTEVNKFKSLLRSVSNRQASYILYWMENVCAGYLWSFSHASNPQAFPIDRYQDAHLLAAKAQAVEVKSTC